MSLCERPQPMCAIYGPFEESELPQNVYVLEEYRTDTEGLEKDTIPGPASDIDGSIEIDSLQQLVSLYNQINRYHGQRYVLEHGKKIPKAGSVEGVVGRIDQKVQSLEVDAIQVFKDGIMRVEQLKAAGFSDDDIDDASATMYAELLKKIGPGRSIKSKTRKAFLKEFTQKKQSHLDHSNVIPF